MPRRFSAVNVRKGRPSDGLPKWSKILEEVKAFSLGLLLYGLMLDGILETFCPGIFQCSGLRAQPRKIIPEKRVSVSLFLHGVY